MRPVLRVVISEPDDGFCSCGQRLPVERELVHADENGDDACADCCADSACQSQRAAIHGLFGAIQRHPSSKPVVDRAVLRAVMEPK